MNTPRFSCKRTSRLFGIAAAILLCLGIVSQSAHAQSTLTGTITNAATGRTLQGARVAIKNTSIETNTDALGFYRIPNVSKGSVILNVSYTGLETVDIPVTVDAAIVRRDVGLTSNLYVLDKLVVAGEREGFAKAITMQRQSMGVQNIISTDFFGNVAGNPADLVARLPGVNTTGFEGDTRFVQIRGLHQNMTTVTVDGNRLAAASGQTNRNFPFFAISSDTFESLELTKSPTPDMDADSIGGAVNLISKSAFDSTGERRIRASIGATPQLFDDREPTTSKPTMNYALSYSQVFKEKYGIAFDAGHRVHGTFQDGVSTSRRSVPAGSQDPQPIYAFNFEDFRMQRIRAHAALKFDYKHSDRSRFFINSQYSKYLEHERTFNLSWQTNQVTAGVAADGSYTGTGGIIPGFNHTVTHVRPVNDSLVSINPGLLYVISTAMNISAGGVHRFDKWDINYDAYRSAGKHINPGNRSMTYIARNVGFTISEEGTGNDRFYPNIRQTTGPDLTKLSSYEHSAYNNNGPNAAWDEMVGLSLHATRRFDTPAPTSIKTGIRSRTQNRNRERTAFNTTYLGPDRVAGLNPATRVNDDNLSLFGQANLEPSEKLMKYGTYPFAATPGHNGDERVIAVRNAHPLWFQDNVVNNVRTRYQNDQDFKETISAAYIQGFIELGKLTVLGGFRVENTEVEAEGLLQRITPEERARRAAWVGTVTDAELARRTEAEYSGRQRVEGEYRDVFPGIHFKFSPVPKLITRLSYATNIGRPNINTLIPATNVDDSGRTVSISNPGLKPQHADNFDAAVEYYFEPAGLISVGVFLKEMSNFIFTAGGKTIQSGNNNGFDGQYAGYELTTQYNGGSSRVRGIELNYTQQFSFLPGFWSGFGVFANYTRLSAEGYYGTGGADPAANTLPTVSTRELAGFVPVNANVGISYIRRGLTLRANLGYRGKFLQTYNANQSLLQYRQPWPTLDIRTSYAFAKRYEAYLDVNNVLNEPYVTAKYYNGYSRTLGLNSPQVHIGVAARY